MPVLIYGTATINYELIYKPRKSLKISVLPDTSVVVTAPLGVSTSRIEQILRQKYIWIKKQTDFFAKHQEKLRPKEYLPGESFLYLGRQYRLEVHSGPKDRVRLNHQTIQIYTQKDTQNQKHNQKLLQSWFDRRTEIIFHQRLEKMTGLFALPHPPKLKIRKLHRRWGSYLSSHTVVLNSLLIQADTECIDYVICHELCHYTHKNHSRDFYGFLQSKYPNWKQAKHKLEQRVFGL